MNQTTVSTKYQVVVPKEVRRIIKVKPGQKLNVHVFGEQIILSPTTSKKKMNWPHDHIKILKNPWANENPAKYLEKERSSWD